ncbi:MAG TPA: thermonuclease family protein [Actinomycetota bacterium]|nr:thermonuclease family protein [Actinomycetota bacterium]
MRRLPWVLLLLASCSGHRVDLSVQAPATLHAEPHGYEEARVLRTVDGDTIEVEVTARVDGPGAGEATTGETHTVRLLGIDTPESVSPRAPVECFGREASAATAALLDGATVRLVKDVEERDGFDRLLRYVYLGAELANARLVANGYAHAFTYPPNVRHADLLVGLQRHARHARRGLWSPDACGRQSADSS